MSIEAASIEEERIAMYVDRSITVPAVSVQQHWFDRIGTDLEWQQQPRDHLLKSESGNFCKLPAIEGFIGKVNDVA